MKYLFSTLCCLAVAMVSSVSHAQTISSVPVTEDGTAFAVDAASFYNENANIIGGSTSAGIPTFNTLVFFDTTGLITDSGGTVAAGDITGGSLSFTVTGVGGGDHSGNVEVHYLGSIATIPVQDGGNDSPSDQELLALAQTAGTVVFNGSIAVDESATIDLSGMVDNNSPILVFRFTDPNPAPADNQQSGIAIDNLDLLVGGDVPLKGDVDLDGDVDFGDIPVFIVVLQSGGFQAEADCDCSGVVDFSDIPAFITILQGG